MQWEKLSLHVVLMSKGGDATMYYNHEKWKSTKVL